ncbi:uncharacterized protein LOC105683282 isoform X2 [Athalia rosae]|uniref:uncharacterized protein LOC105683282 isoform X2 n=1 Tax=Athalia rosae TaxID=37344 RepID=UPI002033EE78|nr:uncharacterized protein LOC105683282 isoform X2 [Athalia rosae]
MPESTRKCSYRDIIDGGIDAKAALQATAAAKLQVATARCPLRPALNGVAIPKIVSHFSAISVPSISTANREEELKWRKWDEDCCSRNVNTLERFGDHGGYFDLVVKPMLQQGHEGELCSWLKEMSLMRAVSNCPHPHCKGRIMIWNPARIIDKYNWGCPKCNRKVSIRVGSFFLAIKCDLKLCLQTILGWCQVIPEAVAASYLNLKIHVVKRVYERCAQVASMYVARHPEEWRLGGQDSVLVVDEFPGGYMGPGSEMDATVHKRRNNNSHTILCIAETSGIPPRMWLHMIQAMPERPNLNVSRCGMVEEALKEIVCHAVPGSFIVANSRARCCSYESLQELEQYKVISVENLQKFDCPGHNNLLNNLETIWQTGVEVCEDVQEATQSMGQHILSTHLWRQRR